MWTSRASTPSTMSVSFAAKTAAFSLALAFLSAFASPAAVACYAAPDREAEQAIRIQSELMVIGLTCIKMPGREGLYDGYQRFSRKNSSLIRNYESRLMDHYRGQGVADPERKLHTLRTDMANDISRKAIAMSTLNFCDKYAGHISQALAMDAETVRQWAQQPRPGEAFSEPLCSQ
jgi:hypothetical protein